MTNTDTITNTSSTPATLSSARHDLAAQRAGARKNLVASVWAVAMAVLGAQGCGVEPDAAEDDLQTTQAALQWSSGSTEVASVQTAAGTLVTFVIGPDDELGVAIVGSIGQADEALDRAQEVAAGDPIKLFEALAQKPAPLSLRDAAQRVASGNYRIDASDDGEAPIPSGATLLPATMTATSLCDIDNWAYSGSNSFTYCWPNQYSTPWVKRKADHLSCRIDSVNGPQRVRYRYKSGVTWHTSIDAWLSSGQYMQWTGKYQWAQRWRECQTVENPYSRKHHFRVVGHEWLAALGFNPVSVSFPSP
ncbi:MAG TPA: hypothetical protein VNO30_35365 [Kofleriaceae bacterium]|nr:hypothetical protein [Kofleriaceae bacterium]